MEKFTLLSESQIIDNFLQLWISLSLIISLTSHKIFCKNKGRLFFYTTITYFSITTYWNGSLFSHPKLLLFTIIKYKNRKKIFLSLCDWDMESPNERLHIVRSWVDHYYTQSIRIGTRLAPVSAWWEQYRRGLRKIHLPDSWQKSSPFSSL